MASDDGGPDDGMPDEGAPGRSTGLLIGGAVLTAAAVLAFVLVDPILAAFLGILGVTLLGIGAMARDWDEHSTFEDRELARARKRKEKWERSADARARDRARWEAHQARKARKTES
jgi:hypothetical protein